MKFEDFETGNGTDDLLKEYLLERNPKGMKGESLMEEAALGEMGRGPSLMANPGREAEMEEKLRKAIHALPTPVSTGSRFLKYFFWGSSAAAILFLAFWISSGNGNTTSESGIAANPSSENKTRGNNHSEQTFISENPGPGTVQLTQASGSKEKSAGENKALKKITFADLFEISGNDSNGSVADYFNTGAPGQQPVQTASTEIPHVYFDKISPTPQWIAFASENTGRIETPGGTSLLIPSNCFVTRDGQPVNGTVQLKITESLSPADMLRSGLSLYASGNYFSATGAVNIVAVQNGQELQIANGKEIYAELPARLYSAGNELFYCKENSNGKDWSHFSGKENRMVSLPQEDLYLEQFWCQDHRDQQWNDFLVDFNGPDFENTFVTTLQFRERIKSAWELGHNGNILRIYKNNIDKELYKVDELVADYLRTQNGNPATETPYDAVQKFNAFALQGYTTVLPYDTRGVNLEEQGATAKLAAKNTNPVQVDELMKVHVLRKDYSELLKASVVERRNGSKSPRLRPASQSAPVAFRRGIRLNRTGWFAMGKTIHPANNRELRIQFSNAHKPEKLEVFIMTSDALYNTDIEEGQAVASFVPEGNAWIVAIGFEDGMPWLGIKNTEGNNGVEDLNLQAVNYDQLKQRLQALND